MPTQTAWTVSSDDLKSGNAYRVNSIFTQINGRISQLKALQATLQQALASLLGSSSAVTNPLSKINAIVKVTAAHTLGTSSLTDDGTQVYTLEKLAIGQSTAAVPLDVLGAAAPTAWIRSSVSNGPSLSLLNTNLPAGASIRLGALNLGFVSGSTQNVGATVGAVSAQAWTAGSAQGTNLTFSVVPNGSATSFVAMEIEQSGAVVVGNAGADDGSGALLQVHGNVNLPTGSTYKVNGVAVVGYNGPTVQRTAAPWLGTPTASRATGASVYQNLTGASIFIQVTISINNSTVQLLSDSSASPATIVAEGQVSGSVTGVATLSAWVLNNNYYRVTGGTAASWVELQ